MSTARTIQVQLVRYYHHFNINYMFKCNNARFTIKNGYKISKNNRKLYANHYVSFASKATPKVDAITALEVKHITLINRIGLTQFHLELGWILSDITKQSVSQLKAQSLSSVVTTLSSDNRSKLMHYLNLRNEGSPIQYILGCTDYLGLNLKCKAPILIPRPETEQMCDWIIYNYSLANNLIENKNDNQYVNHKNIQSKWPDSVPFLFSAAFQSKGLNKIKSDKNVNGEYSVLDLCSGSGNISLSLAHYIDNCKVIGMDRNQQAIELADENKLAIEKQHNKKLNCEFIQQDILSNENTGKNRNLSNKFHLLVSNPPYISSHEYVNLQTEVRDYEDSRALIASDNGLQFYNAIIQQANYYLIDINQRKQQLLSNSTMYYLPELVMEIGSEWQHVSISLKLKEYGFNRIELFKDFNDKIRWIAASRINIDIAK